VTTEEPLVTDQKDSRPVAGFLLATAEVHGGTRVIVATVHEVAGGHRFQLTAYDSGHPDESQFSGSAPCLDGNDLGRALGWAQQALTPYPDACGCWPNWDPSCGRVDCTNAASAELAKAGA
jgi:hypothetical protein